MANTPDVVSCLSPVDGERRLLQINPFYALNYHFGMLLGEEDFKTEQAYHRGKMRLHNAWLHREGVVWGLEVQVALERGALRVKRGLALDGAGQELRLEEDACVNIGAWFEKHHGDVGFTFSNKDGKTIFDAHVVIGHKACLMRQVPALMEPCEGSGSDTAYSRVFETVEILLLPNKAPEPPARPYHRLRLLYGLEGPRTKADGTVEEEDQMILEECKNVLALPIDERQRAWLDLFRRLSALDGIDLKPCEQQADGEASLFPSREATPIVLADIEGVVLEKKDEKWVVSAGTVHHERRSAHVATSAIQELTCAALLGRPGMPDDAGGPRVVSASVDFEDQQIAFRVDRKLFGTSVKPEAFCVSCFEDVNGWKTVAVQNASYTEDEESKTWTVVLNLAVEITGKKRLIARGTGERPLLGIDYVPLAGADTDPPVGVHDGKDFVFMK